MALRVAALALLCLSPASAWGQAQWSVDGNDDWVRALLEEHPEDFGALLEDPEAWRLQILVGEVSRDAQGAHAVQIHPYRRDAEYVYPASALKTIGAVAALRTVQELRELPGCEGLTVDTELMFHRLAPDLLDGAGRALVVSEAGRTTLRRELEGALVVSSNSAFNRLYDFAGHAGLNLVMAGAGLESVRMRHRLSAQGLPERAHRMAPEVSAALARSDQEVLPSGVFADMPQGWRPVLAARESALTLTTSEFPRQAVGSAHVAPLSGRRVDAPMDFTTKNAVSLSDLLHIVAYVADPALAPSSFDLDAEHVDLLRTLMGRVPDASERFKPMSPGMVEHVGWERLRYINKAGRAFGFHLDVAYVQDAESGREALVAAAIYANPNGVLNDDDYAYESVSYPFLQALGAAVAERILVAPSPD